MASMQRSARGGKGFVPTASAAFDGDLGSARDAAR